MKKLYLLLLSTLTISALGACVKGTIEVQDAYAYATTQIQKNGAVFMVLDNTSGSDDKVLSATGAIAERIELHTHTMDGGIIMMRAVEQYDVPARGQTTLEPTGHHIMLMGLKQALNEGSSFPLTLVFEKRAPLIIDVKILAPGDKP